MHENIHACTSMNADICVGGVCPKGSGLGKEFQEVQRGCLCSCDFLSTMCTEEETEIRTMLVFRKQHQFFSFFRDFTQPPDLLRTELCLLIEEVFSPFRVQAHSVLTFSKHKPDTEHALGRQSVSPSEC